MKRKTPDWPGCISRKLPFFIALALLSACSSTRYLKEGETFYNGAEFEWDTRGKSIGRKKILEKELKEYINPKPNAKFLGSRPAVWFYYATGNPRKKKGFNNFLKNKLGKAPVLLKDASPVRTANTLSGYLYNEGYFKSEVTASVKTKKKESTVIYTVKLERPFRLRNIEYPKAKDSTYMAIIQSVKDKSLLKEKQRYQLGRLEAEQKRIEKELKDYGFYYFDDRYLLFVADSTVGQRQVDLDLEVEPDIPRRARRIYTINEVTIYPEYLLSQDSLATRGDSTNVNGYTYVERSHLFRPHIITDIINLKKGETYSKESHDLTINHLMGLGTFKFVNVKFRPAYKDSSLLNALVFLTPLKRNSIRMEVQGVSKSNNFVGPGVAFTFTDKNFMRGAELFQVKLNSAYEVQVSRQNQQALNSFELGLETSLTFPRFITPVPIDFSSRRYLPKTQIKAGFNLQSRVGYFRLNSFNVAYGYNWRETAAKTHELFPIDITFVKTDKKSQEFEDRLEANGVLAKSFEDQFIIGTRYSYTLNTQLMEQQVDKYEKRQIRTNSFYFRGGLDVAGNLLYSIQDRIEKTGGTYQLLGNPYSQFVRGDLDFRYYWQPDLKNKIATRLNVGAGYAYGNSSTLPYIKQFSIGGSNSIRAFQARSLGPGTYNVRTDPRIVAEGNRIIFIDQRADFKLEGNLEYRFDIYKSFKGALFVDAGNIWAWKEDGREGARFNKDTFLNQLAVGTGLGLRYDFSFFVLRLDTAFPLRKPYEVGHEWVLDKIDFASSSWRGSNLIFNIAIGYPF